MRAAHPILLLLLMAAGYRGIVASPRPETSPQTRADAASYEGYGSLSQGGASGDVYHVTSLADSGPGSLRHGLISRKGRPRTIVFDVGGTITLSSTISIGAPYLTIDGSSAPHPGITIRQNQLKDEFIIGGTHDVILRHLRFHGAWVPGGRTRNNAATISIDGDSRPDKVSRNIVLDHITARGGADAGPDIWGEVRDVTISWCFFFYNLHPTTISHYPAPYQTRQRISMHHNVYAKNDERQPQIRAAVDDFDFVNNVIYDWGYFARWGGYGIRIRNERGEPKVNGNFINNYLIARTSHPAWGLVYGSQPGWDSTDGGPSVRPPQGTVVTTSRMGRLFVAGNILPAANRDHYSTVGTPLPVPAHAQVTTWPASMLETRVLPHVGTKHRDREEQAILDEIAAAMDQPGSSP